MPIKSISFENENYDISYEIVNPSALKDIIFLHGWGSNKDIMKTAFCKYLPNFRHIYIDMPGFGKSSTSYTLNTLKYIAILESLLEKLSSDKFIIAGHSYGGKVATSLNPKNLVLLSSAGILEEKSASTKRKIFFAKLFKKLGLGFLTKSLRSKDVDNMSENMYETFKNVLNEDYSSNFENYKGNALIFWGEKDTATSLESGKKISNLIKKSTFVSYDGDHYFFLKHSKDICERIENGIL